MVVASRPGAVSSPPPSPSNRARSAARRSGSRETPRPTRSRIAVAPPDRHQELRRREQDGALDRADAPLVGRIERAERVDLVTEELDPDRQRQRRREDVDDPAATRRLAATGDLGDRHVPEVEQLVEECVLAQPRPDPQLAWRVRQVGRGDRVLEECLDAGDEDASAPGPPGCERRHPCGRLVRDELAPLVGERRPRFEDRDGVGVAQPGAQFFNDPVADLGVARDPDQAFAGACLREGGGEVALGPVRDRDQPDVAAAARLLRRAAESFAERRERAGRGQEWGECRQVGEPVTGLPPGIGGDLRGGSWTRRLPEGVLDLGVHLGDVEVDLFGRTSRGVACREVGRDPLGDPTVATAPAADRRLRHAQASGLAGRIRRHPVRVRRIPSASGGPSTSPGAASALGVGRSELEHVVAVGGLVRPIAGPCLDGVSGRIEQFVETLLLVGREPGQDVVDRVPIRLPDPDPETAELLGPKLVHDGAQAVVATRAATLAEAELAERQGEIVGHDEQVDERSVLTSQHLAHRQAGIVHVGERLDERDVEAAEAPRGDVGRVALASLARPAGALGDPVHDQPADVVAGPGVLRAGVPEPDDDLHATSEDSTSGPDPAPGGPGAMVQGIRRR